MGSAKIQGEIWGARAPDWADANEPAWEQVFSAVLDHLNPERGSRLLDIGCGAGGFLRLAQARGVAVSGIDAAETLTSIARSRLPNVTIETGEMEELPFANETFDLAVGLNAFQFASDPVQALWEARRVCRSGGTVAMLVWGPKEDCEMLKTVLPPVFGLMPPSPAPAAPPLSKPGVMESLMREAGLIPGQRVDIDAPLTFANFDTAVRAVMSAMARPIRHAGEEAVHEAIRHGLHRITTGQGPAVLRNRFYLLAGKRD